MIHIRITLIIIRSVALIYYCIKKIYSSNCLYYPISFSISKKFSYSTLMENSNELPVSNFLFTFYFISYKTSYLSFTIFSCNQICTLKVDFGCTKGCSEDVTNMLKQLKGMFSVFLYIFLAFEFD